MRSSITSRIINGTTPNYDQLNRIFRGFLDSARWFPKPIATAREPLIYQHILDLFAPPCTVYPTVLLRDLNFKLSDRAPPDKMAPTSSPGPSPRRFSKWRIVGRKPWQRLGHVVQNLQKSWRFLSRDILRRPKQNGSQS